MDTQKEPKRCPLLPIAREARLRGYSPLRTPKGRSSAKKAKKRRSAALFLTLFYPSPFDPSGAKNRRKLRCRGAQCAPVQLSDSARFLRASNARPYSHRVDGCRGRRPRRPEGLCVVTILVVGWRLCRFVGRGLDPSLRFNGYERLHGRIWNPPLRENINFAMTQNCTGRRGRRPLRATYKLASTRGGPMQASAPTEWVVE